MMFFPFFFCIIYMNQTRNKRRIRNRRNKRRKTRKNGGGSAHNDSFDENTCIICYHTYRDNIHIKKICESNHTCCATCLPIIRGGKCPVCRKHLILGSASKLAASAARASAARLRDESSSADYHIVAHNNARIKYLKTRDRLRDMRNTPVILKALNDRKNAEHDLFIIYEQIDDNPSPSQAQLNAYNIADEAHDDACERFEAVFNTPAIRKAQKDFDAAKVLLDNTYDAFNIKRKTRVS
jgi:hypothetical protein